MQESTEFLLNDTA